MYIYEMCLSELLFSLINICGLLQFREHKTLLYEAYYRKIVNLSTDNLSSPVQVVLSP